VVAFGKAILFIVYKDLHWVDGKSTDTFYDLWNPLEGAAPQTHNIHRYDSRTGSSPDGTLIRSNIAQVQIAKKMAASFEAARKERLKLTRT
jgi:hypothetical protein